MPLFSARDLMRFRRLMGEYKLQIRSKMLLYKKFVTGRTWNSLTPYANEIGFKLDIGLSSYYPIPINVQETGRRDGKIPYGFDKIIYQWSIDKGLYFPNDKERIRFSKAVAFNKIPKFGTVQYRNARNTDIFTDLKPTYENQLNIFLSRFISTKVTTKINFL